MTDYRPRQRSDAIYRYSAAAGRAVASAAAEGATQAAMGAAATQIQRVWRGYAARKQMKYTPRKRYKPKKTKTLKTQIKEIKKSLLSDQAMHTNRTRDFGRTLAADGQAVYNTIPGETCGTLETHMANLRYYNPSSPVTLVTAAGASGAYTRQIHFKNLVTTLKMRNNYQVPVQVTCQCWTSKYDTSQSPTDFYSSGLADQGVSLSNTSPLLYITDIDQVIDNWKVYKSKKMILLPGREFTVSFSHKPFDYDPSNFDSHALTYQAKYGSHAYTIRVEGIIGHDTANDEQSNMSCGVDWQLDRKAVITYDAGTNLRDFSYTFNGDSATNGFVTSQVVVDNQPYSVA